MVNLDLSARRQRVLISLHWALTVHELSYTSSGTMTRYKEHPIYGVAVPAPEHQWYSRGLVFDCDLNQTVEIKRIEYTRRMFNTKKQAEEYGLELCKDWIDKQP